ncbi:MAG: hypothetical protein QMD96_02630 [Anaerosomatales bacterium]|nr:hypothetical protein [Anaerosomatales bacterium]
MRRPRPPKKHKTVFAPVDGAAPEYFECPACGFLSGDPAFLSPDVHCPLCGQVAGERRRWPADRIRRLDERIRRYQADGESEVVVILAMTLLETILEDLLDRMLAAHGADLKVRRMVMDTQRAIGIRLGKLFPALAGEEFEEAASELGYADFPKRWRRLREARNAFIHDSPFTGPQEHLDQRAADEAMALLDQAYRLFVLMNNRFVADDGLHGE